MEDTGIGCFTFGVVLLLATGGAVGLLLGCVWLYTCTFTDYRAHHAPFMIPFALATIVFSIAALWFAKFIVRPGPKGAPKHRR